MTKEQLLKILRSEIYEAWIEYRAIEQVAWKKFIQKRDALLKEFDKKVKEVERK